MKKFEIISHRGNLDGARELLENRPDYIDNAIKEGYLVEVDLRFIDSQFWLGHDIPQFEVDIKWLKERSDKLLIHCKNIEAVINLPKYFHTFCHVSDDFTLTNKNFVWVHNLNLKLNKNCLIPLMSKDNINKHKDKCSDVYGVCTDNVIYLKAQTFEHML